MKRHVITQQSLPAPRPAIAQGIDINNDMVLKHNAIYQQCLVQITVEHTVDNALIMPNPYDTAPLSAYAGIWSPTDAEVTLQVQDVAERGAD